MQPWTLPAVNATLNGIATVLLVVGYLLIRRKNIDAHRRVMLSAFAVSAVFLVTYVLDKLLKRGLHTPFNGEGITYGLYAGMLLSHVLLAMAVPVLAILLMRFGLTGQIDRHRRLAKWAYPIWLYVSVTGVVIFFALYVFNPPPPPAP